MLTTLKSTALRRRWSSKNRAKAAGERRIFRAFLLAICWRQGLVASVIEPHPDILYIALGGPSIAFELVELADQGFSHSIARLSDDYDDFESPINRTIKKKWGKKYNSSLPVHLLLYTANRVALWDDRAINEALMKIDSMHSESPFECVWYWGEAEPVMIWEAPHSS